MNIEDIKRYTTLILETASIFLGLSFIVGFLIWNIYLNHLGFIEYDIIQTKFILTGSVFLITILIVAISTILLWRIFKKLFLLFCLILLKFDPLNLTKKASFLKNRIMGNIAIDTVDLANLIISLILFSFIIIILYATFLFPLVPAVFGGGQPRALSIISDENYIQYLNLFGIGKGDGSEIQTENLCIAYENKELVILLLSDRTLELKKEYFKGFGSLAGSGEIIREFKRACGQVALFRISGIRLY